MSFYLGPHAPYDLSPYLQPLVDELMILGEGVMTFDRLNNSTFLLKGRIIMGIFDTPGEAKFAKLAGVGSLIGACSHCKQAGKLSKSESVNGICYFKYIWLKDAVILVLV